jgi:hypothetical protein
LAEVRWFLVGKVSDKDSPIAHNRDALDENGACDSFNGQIDAMSNFHGEVLGLKQITNEKGSKQQSLSVVK